MKDDENTLVDDDAPFGEDSPEWTEADFARARPADEVLKPEILALLVRQQGVSFKQPRPMVKAKTRTRRLKLSPDVLDALRAGGPGWQTRADAILRKALIG